MNTGHKRSCPRSSASAVARCALLVLVVLSTRVAPARAAGYSFTSLGGLLDGSDTSLANGVSADGSVVVGWGVSASGAEAFRWTRSGGMVGLGDLPGGFFQSEATGVSADGSVVIGFSRSASNPEPIGREPFRWTSAGGMIALGDLPGGSFESFASGVSADGSVVVGTGRSVPYDEAFRWTSSGGMVGLGNLSRRGLNSQAFGVSADGSVVVGYGISDFGAEPFRWTSTGGMVGLGDLPGGTVGGLAYGVSADGAVVVGYGSSASGQEAFRWTSAGGMVGLGDLPGGSFYSEATGVSADGSVVVGYGASASDYEGAFVAEAFRWTSSDGMVSLKDYLVAHGVANLTDWTLSRAQGVSADGNTIVGWGLNPRRQPEAWIATVPEPDALLLAALAAAGLMIGSRLRRAKSMR